jgi:hypothetical protein
MNRSPQPKPDLCEQILNLMEGKTADEWRAAGMMLLSVALFKVGLEDRAYFLEGLEMCVEDHVAEFDKAAKHLN